eukprot:4723584-Prymnesium_polylepis.1
MRGFERIVALERLKHLDLGRLVKFMRGAVSSELTDELTPASVRSDMERLLVIEEHLLKAAKEDDEDSIHAACAHAAAAYYSNVLLHAVSPSAAGLGNGRVTLGGVSYHLDVGARCALMWHSAVAV